MQASRDKSRLLLGDACNELSNLFSVSPYVYPFWFEYQRDPNRWDYNIVFSQRLSEEVSLKKLKDALYRFIQANPLLNAHLVAKEDKLFWCLNEVVLSLQTLSNEKEANDFCQKPFKLTEGWLYRFAILPLSETTDELILVFHHALLSGHTYDALIDEIACYYNHPTRPPRKFDYVSYELFVQTSDATNATLLNEYDAVIFWKKCLDELPPKNEFPALTLTTDSSGVDEVVFACAKPAYHSTIKTSQFNVIMACWGIVIARFCRRASVHINYPVSLGKNTPVGFLVNANLLVCPFKLIETATFSDVFSDVDAFVQSLRINEDYKYSQLVSSQYLSSSSIEQLDIGITQVSLKLKALPLSQGKAIALSHRNIDMAGSDVLLQYDVGDNGQLQFKLMYKRAFLHVTQSKDLIASFRYILKIATRSPYTRIYDVPFLSAAHAIDQLPQVKSDSWNKPIWKIFSDTVQMYPGKLAIVSDEVHMTYLELDEKSNVMSLKLAACLGCITSSQECIVAVLLSDRVDAMIAILAVIKTGLTYLPLDCAFPAERVGAILKDAGVLAVIADDVTAQRVSGGTDFPEKIHIIRHSDNDGTIQNTKANLQLRPSSSDSILYVIYTSGSSGEPKGVAIKQAGVVNFINHQIKKLNVNSTDRIALLHGLTFDASVEQYMLSFFTGATLLIADPRDYDDPFLLTQFLAQHQVTHIDMTPSFLNVYDVHAISSLRRVITGAEPCTYEVVDKYSSSVFINEYGPTETTIVSLQYIFPTGVSHRDHPIFIGKPIANTMAYIVDEHMHLVPDGVVGELCISGVGLAAGYVKQGSIVEGYPFVSNPFLQQDDVSPTYHKLYKTGDLVRRYPCGNIEYISRKDNQVKLNGYRVNLLAIESVANQLSDIEQVKVCIMDVKGTKALVLYCVSHSSIRKEMIYYHLLENLPSYMVPTHYVFVDKLPITTNFKLDTQRLIQQTDSIQECEINEFPQTTGDFYLSALIASVVGRSNVRLSDTLMSLGMNSLLAVKLIARLRNENHYCLLSDIFASLTVKELLVKIRSHTALSSLEERKIIQYSHSNYLLTGNADKASYVFFFPPGNAGVESYANNLVKRLENTYRCVLFDDLLTRTNDYTSVESLAARYVEDILFLQPSPPYYLFGTCFGGIMAFEILRQLRNKTRGHMRLVMVDAYFDFHKRCYVNTAEELPYKEHCMLNYLYRPPKINLEDDELVLFRATRVESKEALPVQLKSCDQNAIDWLACVNRHYVKHCPDNGLGCVAMGKYVKVVNFDETHSSWIKNSQLLDYISGTIASGLENQIIQWQSCPAAMGDKREQLIFTTGSEPLYLG